MDTSSPPTSTFTEVDVDGATYAIDLPFADTDYIQSVIRSTGTPYERDMLLAMAATVDDDDLVIDVGANIGNHSLFLAAICGARVISYEPDPRLTEALTRSAEANGLSEKITVRTVAVAEKPGELTLVDDVDGNLGGQHLASETGAEGQRVPVVRLDDEKPVSPVRAMKLDVEGYELNVLEGARALLDRDHPELWIECLDLEHYRSITSLLAPLGYRIDGVYNPSPTYRFVHDPQPRAESIASTVDRIVERFYAEHTSFVQTRESLIDANAKYRTVTQQYGDLRDRHFHDSHSGSGVETSTLVALRQAEERTAELQIKLNEADAKRFRTAEECRRQSSLLTEENERLRSEKGRALRAARRRVHRVLRDSRGHADELRGEIQQLTSQLADAKTQLGEAHSANSSQTDLVEELNALLHERDGELNALAAKQARYRDDFNLLREHISRTDVTVEQLEADLSNEAAEHEVLESSLRDLREQLRTMTRRASELEAHGKILGRARDNQIALADSLAMDLRAATAEKDALGRDLSAAKKHQQVLTRARDNQLAAAASLRTELTTSQEKCSEASTALDGAKHESDRLADELLRAQASLQELRGSRTYRAGKAWREAGTWNGFWTLVHV